MAELVRDHALQFFAVELVQATLGHRDRRIRRRIAGGEGVDRRFAFEHVDLGHRHAGGDGDFLDHVAQALVREIGCGRLDEGGTELARDHAAAAAQGGDLVHRTGADDADHEHAVPEHHRADAGMHAVPGRTEREEQHEVERGDDARHRKHEQHEHALGVCAGALLLGEEIHRRTPPLSAGTGIRKTIP